MFVVTGNRLLDGIVVFLAPANRWLENLQLARCFPDQNEAEEAMSREQHGAIISMEVIPVLEEDGEIVPERLRERIRSDGPTVSPFESIDLTRTYVEAAEYQTNA